MEYNTNRYYSQDSRNFQEPNNENLETNEEFIDDVNPNSFDENDKEKETDIDDHEDFEGEDDFEEKDSNYIEKPRRTFNRNFCL